VGSALNNKFASFNSQLRLTTVPRLCIQRPRHVLLPSADGLTLPHRSRRSRVVRHSKFGRPMSLMGQSRHIVGWPKIAPCPLFPDSDLNPEPWHPSRGSGSPRGSRNALTAAINNPIPSPVNAVGNAFIQNGIPLRGYTCAYAYAYAHPYRTNRPYQ
jgi:hypothetical protein